MTAAETRKSLFEMIGDLSARALRDDIDYLLSTLMCRHPDPFFHTSEQALRRYCQLFSARVEEMLPGERLVKLLAIPPLLMDGHTRFRGTDAGEPSTLDRWPGNLTSMPLPGDDRLTVLKYDSVLLLPPVEHSHRAQRHPAGRLAHVRDTDCDE